METSKRMLTNFVSIRSYSHEVRTFGTVITSTKLLPARANEQGNWRAREERETLFGERSEPLSMVFNDQPSDI